LWAHQVPATPTYSFSDDAVTTFNQGTGKTLTARALANSLTTSFDGGRRVSFFMRKGADCLSKWVGEGERQLRLLFEQVRFVSFYYVHSEYFSELQHYFFVLNIFVFRPKLSSPPSFSSMRSMASHQ
jgi:SpoVK/Ycf46/Vps4 family AAA+-type ATPase